MESYKTLCTEFYDLTKPEPPENVLRYYVHLAELQDGLILEPMCGSGRYLIAMLKRGLDVAGTDASEEMLASCRRRCESLGFAPLLRLQTLDQLDVPGRYGLVFIPAGSIGLIVESDLVKAGLRRIYEHLQPGGLFAVEVETLAAYSGASGIWQGRWVDCPDGARIVLSTVNRYDESRRINETLMRYERVRDGRVVDIEMEYLTMHYYELAEFEALLVEAGFEQIRALKPYTNQDADEAEWRVVFQCRKP